MTSVLDIQDNASYRKILDHGFVGLIDTMPTIQPLENGLGSGDLAIVQAARVSYGKGTTKKSDDIGLIRYLVRHRHTTPLEMVEAKFHMKLPIFVARQMIRHRTASVNEMSARYSILPDDAYSPAIEQLQPQSTANKQGRSGEISESNKRSIKQTIDIINQSSYEDYLMLLGEEEDSILGKEYTGLARELSRMVLPVSYYTEWYWKCDLHNIFHFLKLRMDSHAQYEIQVYANAIYELIKPLAPAALKAFEDYILKSYTASGMEIDLIGYMLQGRSWSVVLAEFGGENQVRERFGLSKRELTEFKEKFRL